jgi:hypothetical protein
LETGVLQGFVELLDELTGGRVRRRGIFGHPHKSRGESLTSREARRDAVYTALVTVRPAVIAEKPIKEELPFMFIYAAEAFPETLDAACETILSALWPPMGDIAQSKRTDIERRVA